MLISNRILGQYIARHVVVAILLVTFLVVSIDFLFALVREMRNIAPPFGMLDAIGYLLLTLPRRVVSMFPMTALLGSVVGLGSLTVHSELVVMRAAGLSYGAITRAALGGALILIVALAMLSEWVVPSTERFAGEVRAQWRQGVQSLQTQTGLWLKDEQRFIYIQSLNEAGDFQGFYSFEVGDEHNLESTSFVPKGHWAEDGWAFPVAYDTEFGESYIDASLDVDGNYITQMNSETFDIIVYNPRELSLQELQRYINYLDANDLDSSQAEFWFWQKLLQPLAILSMVFLAVQFIFGPLRSTSAGIRWLVAFVVGFVFYLLNEVLGPVVVVYHWWPWLGALFPSMLMLGIGLVLYSRLR